MNIVLVVNSIQAGGAERVAATLVNAWASRGDVATLVVADSMMRESFYPIHRSVDLLYLRDRPITRGRRGFGDLRNILRLRGIIRRAGATHVVSFTSHVNLAMLIACIGLGVPTFVSERTYPPLVPLGIGWSTLRRLLYPLAFKVVMQTNQGLDWLRKAIPHATGVVIQNPVEYPMRQRAAAVFLNELVGDECAIILGVGRLDEGKQFQQLITAFSRIAPHYPLVRLIIFGEGPDRLSLENLVKQYQLIGSVFLPGQTEDLSKWYTRASLYVLTSRFEGFPNSLAEALTHGCPAISYDCATGPKDIIRDGVDGMLVSPVGDIDALTVAIEFLLKNENLRTRMAERAIEARERFSVQRALYQWDRIFSESP